jgi:hypothetical protein
MFGVTAIFDSVKFLLTRAPVHTDQPVRTKLEDAAAEEDFAQAAFGHCLDSSERIRWIGAGRWRPHPFAKKRVAVRRQRRAFLPHGPGSRRRLCARWVGAARPLCPAGRALRRAWREAAGRLSRGRVDSARLLLLAARVLLHDLLLPLLLLALLLLLPPVFALLALVFQLRWRLCRAHADCGRERHPNENTNRESKIALHENPLGSG